MCNKSVCILPSDSLNSRALHIDQEKGGSRVVTMESLWLGVYRIRRPLRDFELGSGTVMFVLQMAILSAKREDVDLLKALWQVQGLDLSGGSRDGKQETA